MKTLKKLFSSDVVVEEKTIKKLVDEIHESFYTEVDKLGVKKLRTN